MRTNKVKVRIRAGKKAYGCRILFPSTTIIELMGLAGFDYVILYGEHGPFTLKEIEEMCLAADLAGPTPLAHVPNIEPSTILQYLDRGIMGIIGPHIITKDDAEAFVSACFFAPKGNRSFGGSRGNAYSTQVSGRERRTFMEQVNEEILPIALLEDAEALQNLPEILTVEHLELFAFGPTDLAQSMGLPGEPDHPKVMEAIQQAATRIRTADRKVSSDFMVEARANELFLEGAREFLRKTRGR